MLANVDCLGSSPIPYNRPPLQLGNLQTSQIFRHFLLCDQLKQTFKDPKQTGTCFVWGAKYMPATYPFSEVLQTIKQTLKIRPVKTFRSSSQVTQDPMYLQKISFIGKLAMA